MNISQLRESKFLKRADVGPGILVTIKGDVYQENIAKEGAPEELKWCIEFEECEKPMVLNGPNGQLIAQICGSEESENWKGKKIVLYDDPSVSFGGKLVGGIRARAPRGPKMIVPGVASRKPGIPIPAPQQSISGINNPVLRNPPPATMPEQYDEAAAALEEEDPGVPF